jgi:hypothetical protein
VGISYKVNFGHDPVTSRGGGMLSSFEAVPGTIHLDGAANMEVSAVLPPARASLGWLRSCLAKSQP